VEAVREDLQVSAQRIEAQTGPKLAAIFEAHEAMLGDVSLLDEIRDEIERELTSAAHALGCSIAGKKDSVKCLTKGCENAQMIFWICKDGPAQSPDRLQTCVKLSARFYCCKLILS
jgi:hypothetical protein